MSQENIEKSLQQKIEKLEDFVHVLLSSYKEKGSSRELITRQMKWYDALSERRQKHFVWIIYGTMRRESYKILEEKGLKQALDHILSTGKLLNSYAKDYKNNASEIFYQDLSKFFDTKKDGALSSFNFMFDQYMNKKKLELKDLNPVVIYQELVAVIATLKALEEINEELAQQLKQTRERLVKIYTEELNDAIEIYFKSPEKKLFIGLKKGHYKVPFKESYEKTLPELLTEGNSFISPYYQSMIKKMAEAELEEHLATA
jgi:hypothetical protein